ncbi:hypothetical protein N7522_007033 [Penicillium canescens]|nr:hypothetical protein N7522_007033 [Penicillium canescens]
MTMAPSGAREDFYSGRCPSATDGLGSYFCFVLTQHSFFIPVLGQRDIRKSSGKMRKPLSSIAVHLPFQPLQEYSPMSSTWISSSVPRRGQTAKEYGQNYQCTEDQKFEFHEDPSSSSFMLKTSGTRSMESSRAFSKIPMRKAKCEGRMVGLIKCENLPKGFTVKCGVGCRRVTPGNVDVHFTGVDRLTEDGVVGSDGVERKVDTVYCATAFDATSCPAFHLIGKSEADLSAKWAKAPECYMGLTIPDFPNLITFNGPT